MKTESEVLILFGGGLDSGVMVERYASLNPFLLYFDYGQKASQGERRALRYFAHKHSLGSLATELPSRSFAPSPLTSKALITDAQQHSLNYIPGRNMLFAAFAFSLASAHGFKRILLGASPAPESSAFHDAKSKFADLFNTLTEFGYPGETRPVLEMPLVHLNRRDYIAEALKTEPLLFNYCFTCYESIAATYECGKCVHCQQKAELARELGVSSYFAARDGSKR